MCFPRYNHRFLTWLINYMNNMIFIFLRYFAFPPTKIKTKKKRFTRTRHCDVRTLPNGKSMNKKTTETNINAFGRVYVRHQTGAYALALAKPRSLASRISRPERREWEKTPHRGCESDAGESGKAGKKPVYVACYYDGKPFIVARGTNMGPHNGSRNNSERTFIAYVIRCFRKFIVFFSFSAEDCGDTTRARYGQCSISGVMSTSSQS